MCEPWFWTISCHEVFFKFYIDTIHEILKYFESNISENFKSYILVIPLYYKPILNWQYHRSPSLWYLRLLLTCYNTSKWRYTNVIDTISLYKKETFPNHITAIHSPTVPKAEINRKLFIKKSTFNWTYTQRFPYKIRITRSLLIGVLKIPTLHDFIITILRHYNIKILYKWCDVGGTVASLLTVCHIPSALLPQRKGYILHRYAIQRLFQDSLSVEN